MKALLFFCLLLTGRAAVAEGPSTKPFTPSAEEKALIDEAHRDFQRAKKLKAPSAHMQKKMQSGLEDGKK